MIYSTAITLLEIAEEDKQNFLSFLEATPQSHPRTENEGHYTRFLLSAENAIKS